MKRISLLLAITLPLLAATAISATPPRVVFDLDSTTSTYPFVMRLQGTATAQGDSIVVELRSGAVRSTIPATLGDQGVARDIRIVFGLGEKTAQGWTTSHDTPAQIVAPSLSPGETRVVAPLRFVIRGISAVPLRDRWLAAGLGVTQQLPGLRAGLLWSYACAEDNLMGATESSRERAQLMRAAYARTC